MFQNLPHGRAPNDDVVDIKMSEKESQNSELERKLIDITECSICKEAFKEPRILSCIHTFCKNCLQEFAARTEKSTGDEIPCPVCRKKFLIPEEGIDGLQKNFFMEKLIEMRNILNPSSDRNVCESCLDADPAVDEGELPVAEVYCSDCQLKLCTDCHKFHLKSKIMKSHEVLSLADRVLGTEAKMEKILPEFCDRHEKKQPLIIYCSTCKDAVCAICFFESHKSHEGTAVDLVAKEFQEQIQVNVDNLVKFIPALQHQEARLKDDEVEFTENLNKLEIEIMRRKDEIRALVDLHSNSLLSELHTRRESSLKNKAIYMDDSSNLLVSLDSFSTYCNQIMSTGSATTICQTFSSLNNRAVELEKLCNLHSANAFAFRHVQLSSCMASKNENMFGKFEECITEKDYESKERDEASAKECKSKSGLKDQMQAMGGIEMDLKRKIADLEEEVLRLHGIECDLKKKINDLEQQVILLRGIALGECAPAKTPVSIDYKKSFKLQRNIEVFSSSDTSDWKVNGLAILGSELFIIVKFIPYNMNFKELAIQVYSLDTLQFKRRWIARNLFLINDFKTCKRSECLYFIKLKYDKTVTNEIIRFDRKGKVINVWSVGDYSGQLSITDEANVLFTVWNENFLLEYTSDGQLTRTIPLSWHYGFSHPWHAIKLDSSHYVISHGQSGDSFSRICIIDSGGKVLSYIDRIKNYFCFSRMIHMEIAGDNIIAIDADRNQIIVLSCNLQIVQPRVYSSTDDNCTKMAIVAESNNRIIVVETVKVHKRKDTDRIIALSSQ